MSGGATFHLYRYQILPIDRYFQSDLYDSRDIDDYIARKNDIFLEAITSLRFVERTTSSVLFRVEASGSDWAVLHVAPNRSLQRETADFRTEVIENWPKICLVVLNRPDEQIVAVQQRAVAFQSTDATVTLLSKALRRHLENNHLRGVFEPIFNRYYFWQLVSKYENRIRQIRFDLVTPNMANISGTLPDGLKELAKRTNTIKTGVSLDSDPQARLAVSEDDPVIRGLVDYASEGGGDISLRIVGLRKRIHTSTSKRDITIGELEMSGSPGSLAELLRTLLKP
jgi:hypothetical protein